MQVGWYKLRKGQISGQLQTGQGEEGGGNKGKQFPLNWKSHLKQYNADYANSSFCSPTYFKLVTGTFNGLYTLNGFVLVLQY